LLYKDIYITDTLPMIFALGKRFLIYFKGGEYINYLLTKDEKRKFVFGVGNRKGSLRAKRSEEYNFNI